jgi:hypothetical protein
MMTEEDGMELVLGDIPALPVVLTPKRVPYNPDNLPTRGLEDEENDEQEEEDSVPLNNEKKIPDSPLDAKETNPIVVDDDDDDIQYQSGGPEDVARRLLGVFCAEDMAFLPENLSALIPENICAPLINLQRRSTPPKRGLSRNLSYYNDQFAVKFLDVSEADGDDRTMTSMKKKTNSLTCFNLSNSFFRNSSMSAMPWSIINPPMGRIGMAEVSP